jgi:hypothetical protein
MKKYIIVYNCYDGEYHTYNYDIVEDKDYKIIETLTNKVNELSHYEDFELLECYEIVGKNIKFEPEEIVVKLKISKE